MEREEAEALARKQFTRKKVLRLVVGVPMTWATIFLLWTGFLGVFVLASEQRAGHAVDLVIYPGLFLATVLTPLLSLEPLLGSLHDIVSYRNLQTHIARMDSMSRRKG